MSRSRSQYEVRSYAGRELYQRILREAAVRKQTVSQCVRADLEQHYATRDELLAAFECDPRAEEHRTLMHALLAGMEERLAASIGRQVATLAALEERLRLLETMIDRHYLGMMLHLAEVPGEEHEGRFDSAEERRRAWRTAVQEFLQGGDESDDDAPTGTS